MIIVTKVTATSKPSHGTLTRRVQVPNNHILTQNHVLELLLLLKPQVPNHWVHGPSGLYYPIPPAIACTIIITITQLPITQLLGIWNL